MKPGDTVTVHTPGSEECFPATVRQVKDNTVVVSTTNGHLSEYRKSDVTAGSQR